MRSAFQYVANNYLAARAEPFKDNRVAQFLRQDAAEAVASALGPLAANMRVEGSPGKGGWAEIPWVAIFDPVVTTSAMRGHYVVYLFSADMQRLYLSLNQGTTEAQDEFKSHANAELARRAEILRDRVPEYKDRFSSQPIDLASSGPLPSGYEAGHAFGTCYRFDELPLDDIPTRDLLDIVELYLTATARGGTAYLGEPSSSEDDTEGATLIERRQYSFHRRIDRDSKASKEAKKVHGYVCQACGIDFERQYGSLGHEYIEAHHLTPIGELPEGVPVPQDPKKDFAVLCANCHRMIHRKDAPREIDEFRRLIQIKFFE